MGHQNQARSGALAGVGQYTHDLRTGALIQGTRGFVGKDDFGIGDERAPNRNALRLTAGELTWAVRPCTLQPQIHQDLLCAGNGLFTRNSCQHQGHCNIFLAGKFWKQLPILEHETKVLEAQFRNRTLTQCCHFSAIQGDASRRRSQHSCQAVQKRRLPAPRGSHNCQLAALGD